MKQKNILSIIIPLFIFALAWVGFSIHHNAVTSTISGVLNMAISPINPTFNTGVIDKLDKRIKIAPLYELNSNSSSRSAKVPSIKPKPSPTPLTNSTTSINSASPSASPAPSQTEASPGAIINRGGNL